MEFYQKLQISIRFHDFKKYSELINDSNIDPWICKKRKAYNFDKDRYYNEGCLTWIDDIDTIKILAETNDGHCVFKADDEYGHSREYTSIESRKEFEEMITNTRAQAESEFIAENNIIYSDTHQWHHISDLKPTMSGIYSVAVYIGKLGNDFKSTKKFSHFETFYVENVDSDFHVQASEDDINLDYCYAIEYWIQLPNFNYIKK